jgi:hypothetical protein
MANPSKKKGTGGETEVMAKLNFGLADRDFRRTAPTLPYDVASVGWSPAIDVLATRPDRGEWLVTVRLADFIMLLDAFDRNHEPFFQEVHVEVKRYARFALHSIFEGKFGNK